MGVGRAGLLLQSWLWTFSFWVSEAFCHCLLLPELIDSLQDSLYRYSGAETYGQVSVLSSVGTLGIGMELAVGVPS